jgi:RNA polymerase sigma-70 factor (ECF subfamily)
MAAVSDNQIVEHIRKGKKQEYALLVDRYKDKAFSLALRMLKNRQDAEEASQDAFVRAYRALDSFEGTAKFGTWLYRIVYNVCLTRIAQRKDDLRPLEYVEDEGYGEEDPKSFVEALETKDMMRFVLKALEALPEKYATILSLFYMQEMSHGEICEITQLPLGTVKVHLFRARLLLQKRLAEELAMENV